MAGMKELTHDEKVIYTRMVIALLDEWGVANADKVTLLALPAGTRARSIAKYQNDTPLPDDDRVQERIEHLVNISEALQRAYPRNIQWGARWLNRHNRRFPKRTPLTVMIEDGLAGIVSVRRQVDCSYDWYVDELESRRKG